MSWGCVMDVAVCHRCFLDDVGWLAGSTVVQWLARQTFNLKVSGSSLLSALVLFPWTRNPAPHCFPPPWYICCSSK